jgi:hypothetical protein
MTPLAVIRITPRPEAVMPTAFDNRVGLELDARGAFIPRRGITQ